MIDLKNKNVVITGASGGIGESLVKKFAEYGSNIFLLSRDANKMKTIISKLSKNDNQIIAYYTLDITKDDDVENVFKRIITAKKLDDAAEEHGVSSEDEAEDIIETGLGIRQSND